MKKVITILFAVALGLNLSAQTVSPTYDPDVDGDNNIGINDLLALLSLFAENDEDDDGIWDSQDDCVGAYDECGVCNGPGPTVSVIESITILYDSVYAEQIDEWWVYEVGADTVFNYFCVTQLDDTNIHEAVDLWLSDEAEALALYGPISAWDVSDVTNMTSLFEGASNFNGDISAWDVSSVTDMSWMFDLASSFNGDISGWDLSGVENMREMFNGASSFNGDISSWDVSSVTDMAAMFASAHSFNSDISAWDVSNATDISWMFYNANIFNSDISAWNVSNVVTMTTMFYGAPSFNGDLSSWDVSNVTTMNQMFVGANSFSSDISSWDVSSVTNMRWMFYNAIIFNSDISVWDVSNVTDMTVMFRGANSFNSDISSWDVSSVTNMNQMFYEASNFNGDISSWDVSNVTDMTEMFDYTPLSDENKCAIHLSFSANTNWPYEWADFCPFAIFNSCGDDIGYGGYDYATVQIGEQCWFAENLRTELYQNGDSIPGGLSDIEWQSAEDGAQSIGPVESDPLRNGRLYNGYAVTNSNGLCPVGWVIPTDDEWVVLEEHIGMADIYFYSYGWRGDQIIGYDLKASEVDPQPWGGTNIYGFTATAGGYRGVAGNYLGTSTYGYWWSSSETNNNLIWRGLYSASGDIGRNEGEKELGYSVRCLKDTEE